MKLTDGLKKQLEQAKSKEEAKEIIEKARMLKDDELDAVSGGHMMWGRTCRICGGLLGNDPDIPDSLKCHCEKFC